MKSRRQLILSAVSDLVAGLMYYDRKEDENLPPGSVEEAIGAGEITVDETVDEFRKAIGDAQ